MKYKLDLIVLTIIESLLGVAAFVGGWSMLTDPSGISLFKEDLRQYIIVPNFFLPGLWLIFAYGFGTFIFIIGLWLHFKVSWIIGIVISVSQFIWIGIQIVLLFPVPHIIIWQILIPLIAFDALMFLFRDENKEFYYTNGLNVFPKHHF